MHISKGVPQGSCISPILFNIYTRLLPDKVSDPIFQFADDITNSTSANNVEQIETNLTENFRHIKEFCQELNLKINTEKTQCIILKLPSKKMDKPFELQLDNVLIKSSNAVEVLGLTIDQHLSFKLHIDKKIKKCHGLMGLIQRARGTLPQNLLKLSFTALVRPHLEYCSLILAGAAKTNLVKMETVQKIASRLICGVAKDAHAEPLLQKLGLQTLQERRERKVIKTVKDIFNENCHPMLHDMFRLGEDGLITNEVKSRTTFDKKKFSSYAKELYNSLLKDTLD